MRVNYKVWIENDQGQLIIGEGLLALLTAIEKTGSIYKASKELDMSYRTAWGKLKKLEERIGLQLAEKRLGGKGGGGTVLTKRGIELLEGFNRLDKEIAKFAELKFMNHFKSIIPSDDKENVDF